MRNTKYTCEMSDGKICRVQAPSAGCAIYQALAENPGLTVKTCRSGLTEAEAFALEATGKKALPGTCTFDVPPHKPLSEIEAARVLGTDEE